MEYTAKPWALILDGASKSAIEFVSQLVQYESSRRMTAAEVRRDLLSSTIHGGEDADKKTRRLTILFERYHEKALAML